MDREKIYKIIKNIYKSENIFNQDVLNERIMFFNSKVKEIFTMFNDVEERMRNIEEIFDLISKYLGVSEVEKKQNGEVFTPFSLINEMLDQLPVEVWSNPNLKWLDPANGIGNFPAVIVQRLMIGLEGFEPDPELRYKHILEKMIYVCDISPKNMFLYLNIFDPEHKYKMNYYRGSFLEEGFDKLGWGRFNVIVGNPPYHKSDGGGRNGTSSVAIYNLFIEKSYKLSDRVLFVTPSRWFSGGKGLDNFRKFMLTNEHLKFINHTTDVKKYFDIELPGGVSYFLLDKEYNGLLLFNGKYIDKSKLDVLLEEPLSYHIIEKIQKKHNGFYMNSVVQSRNYFGITINGNKTLQNGKECVDTKINENYIKCYVSQKEGFEKWVHKDLVDVSKVGGFKVLISKADGNAYGNKKYITKSTLIKPGEVCSETYLTMLVDNQEEGENLCKYILTKFFRFCLSLKLSGQNNSTDKFSFIPKIPLNREWTDQQIYEYFRLTEDEINLIEETIK